MNIANEQAQRARIVAVPGWATVDYSETRFVVRPIHEDKARFVATYTTLSQMFLSYFTDEVLRAIWDHYPRDHWAYAKANGHFAAISKGAFNKALIVKYMAVYIRIMGIQDAPKENRNNKDALRKAVSESVDYFESNYGNHPGHSFSTILKLFSKFHVPVELSERLSLEFENKLDVLGRALACDEKLLHFTGDTGWIRLVQTKPDRIGLWFYEACVTLSNGLPYLVHAWLSTTNASEGTSTSVAECVAKWANIIVRATERNNANKNTLLVMDSYYTSKDSIIACQQKEVLFVAAINSARCKQYRDTMNALGVNISKAGELGVIWHGTDKLLFIHHIDSNADIGTKYVITNAFELNPYTNRSSNGVKFGYDHYKYLFSTCDAFNRNLRDKKFCHRAGGGTKTGQSGHIHKYFMAAAVQNVINATATINRIPVEEMASFEVTCIDLSNQLWQYAMSLDQ